PAPAAPAGRTLRRAGPQRRLHPQTDAAPALPGRRGGVLLDPCAGGGREALRQTGDPEKRPPDRSRAHRRDRGQKQSGGGLPPAGTGGGGPMKAFRALLRVSMTALLRSISPGRGGLALAVGVLALVPLLLSLSLGAALTAALAPLGALDLLPGFLCLMGALLAFFLTAFGAGGLLFGGK